MVWPAKIDTVRSIDLTNGTIEDFCHMLEQGLDRPLVNETHLDGKFDFHVQGEGDQQNNFTERLSTQLGLVVTPARRQVEMLVFTPQLKVTREELARLVSTVVPQRQTAWRAGWGHLKKGKFTYAKDSLVGYFQ